MGDGCRDQEHRPHPARAGTALAHPHGIGLVRAPSGARHWGSSSAATATGVLRFGFLPPPALLVLKLKSVCESVAVLQDPN